MSRSARSDLFARLRAASATDSAGALRARAELGAAPAAPILCDDPVIAFLAMVLRNRGTIDVAQSRSDTVKAIARYLYDQFRSQRLVAGNDPRLAALPWRDAGLLPRFGSSEAYEPVALSHARLGIAESGAVVTFTGKANPAANNLLPEHHIVLVDAGEIVNTLEDAWQFIHTQFDASQRPRGIQFIAGPSSSADIGGKLVTGAHGPRHWHVIVSGQAPDGVLESAGSLAGSAVG